MEASCAVVLVYANACRHVHGMYVCAWCCTVLVTTCLEYFMSTLSLLLVCYVLAYNW